MIRLCMSKSLSCPREERDFSPEGISRDRNSFLSSTGSGSKLQLWSPNTASPTTGAYLNCWKFNWTRSSRGRLSNNKSFLLQDPVERRPRLGHSARSHRPGQVLRHSGTQSQPQLCCQRWVGTSGTPEIRPDPGLGQLGGHQERRWDFDQLSGQATTTLWFFVPSCCSILF